MRIDVLTLFPDMFDGPLKASILGRAFATGVAEAHVHNIRDWATDRHQVVDDYAYGGGPGMVMKPEPLAASIEGVRAMAPAKGRVVLLTPQGRLLNQAVVDELVQEERLILLCGHYEGFDERIREAFVDDEVSIGDYVLSGGEYAALVVIDAVVRRLPGTLGRRRFAAGGVAHGRAAGVPAVHAAGGVSRNEGSGYTSERQPSYGCEMATRAAGDSHRAQTPGTSRQGLSQRCGAASRRRSYR